MRGGADRTGVVRRKEWMKKKPWEAGKGDETECVR